MKTIKKKLIGNLLFVVVFILAGLIDILSYIYLREVLPGIFSTIFVLSLVMVSIPLILVRYTKYKKIKNMEDKFPLFLVDLVEAVRAGMPLPQALKHVSRNDYGELSKHVKKMAAQMEWGIPFDDVLLNFSRKSGSKLIGRMVSTIIESHKFGGNLTDIFEGISETSLQIERLREERKVYLQSQMTTGYVIFFVFLAVLIGMQRFLIPGLASVGGEQVTMFGGAPISEDIVYRYKTVFRNLIILQALFAGLVVGKMAEGSVLAGIKHSFFLLVIGVVVFTVAT